MNFTDPVAGRQAAEVALLAGDTKTGSCKPCSPSGVTGFWRIAPGPARRNLPAHGSTLAEGGLQLGIEPMARSAARSHTNRQQLTGSDYAAKSSTVAATPGTRESRASQVTSGASSASASARYTASYELTVWRSSQARSTSA